MKIGVVIPTYQETENIQPLIREILGHVPSALIRVVDDSPDLETARKVEDLAHSQVSVLHRNEKGGRGSAVLEGIRFLIAQGVDQVVEMDSDFSHPPRQIPELLAHATREKLDLLIASRYLPQSRIDNWPIGRRIFSKSSNILARTVLRVPVSDYTNGFRVYSRRGAELITEHCGKIGKGFIPLSEILVNVYYRGFQVGEVPTIFTNRVRGVSSLNFAEVKNAAFGLVKIYSLKQKLKVKQGKSHVPLEIRS